MASQDHHTRDHHHQHDHTHDEKTSSRVGSDGRVYLSHDGLAPHSHEPICSPGYFSRRAQRILTRDFNERAFTVGISGLVGTGKTALMLSLCKFLRDKYSLAAVTNDIFTKEDGDFLIKHGALPEERIRAVETGGCPHAAIHEDININLGPLEELSNLFKADLLLCESGGGETWTWHRGNCEPHFTRLRSSYWEKTPLTWCIRRLTCTSLSQYGISYLI